VSAAKPTAVFLMYHELELPGRVICQSAPGYARYVLPAKEFESQMKMIAGSGMKGVNVSEALNFERPCVAITFDDGCETDLLSAAQILNSIGLGATFYATAGFIGKPGYMSPGQLRELHNAGFEIGCHSMTHPYLPDLDDAELEREISGAKAVLEQMLGNSVDHFSCPGGRYDSRTVKIAKAAGFRTLATSVPRANTPSTGVYSLGRVAITQGLTDAAFKAICCGDGLWKLQLSGRVRSSAMKMLGNRGYDRLRALLLRS
jgi:peptidoglycan/xylan/chitin deacetylase (PgdA/CDA1 family)